MRKVSDESRRFNFTPKRLEDWPVDGREVCLFDTGKPGLVLRIRRESKVYYHWRTDGKSGKTVKYRIGSMADTSLASARAKVDERNGETVKADGVVPRRERHGPVTLGEAFDSYIAEHVATGGRCEEDFKRKYRLYLEDHAAKPMDSIDREWVREHVRIGIVQRVSASRGGGGQAMADSVLAILSAVFSMYLDNKENNPTGTRANPCIVPKGSKRRLKYGRKARKAALQPDEVPKFIEAVERYKREHGVYKVTRTRLGWVKGQPIPKRMDLADMLLFLLLTGQRRGAVARMKWADLNLDTDKATWTIPAEDDKSKTGKTVTLGPKVAAMLRERRKAAPKDAKFVLPGALGGSRPAMHTRTVTRPRVADPRTIFQQVLDLAGITNPRLVVHSLRATFVTEGIRAKMNLEDIRAAVGHASINTTQIYANLVEDDQRRVTDDIEARMLGREEDAA